MEQEPKYLYYYSNHNELYRRQITRESESSIWLKDRDEEIRINKKRMLFNGTWRTIHYYYETPELLEKFKSSLINRRFKDMLDRLGRNNNQLTTEQKLKFLEFYDQLTDTPDEPVTNQSNDLE